MATVIIPLFLFILVRLTSGFQVIQGGNSTKVTDKDDGKSSLAFVFDTTWSMSNDLRQLRQGAEMILKTALEDSSIISNFVFVPFNDPLVGPATVTKDKRVFKTALNAVKIYGGGDCPEKSLSGIELALNLSLPSSFLYVFTDATASDHKLVTRVLDLVQRKQSQVVFVLTGHCNDLHRPSYQVYQQIAAASSGQVFNLNKTNVHMVLDFVRSSIKGRTVNLASAVRPAGYNYTQGIQVDKLIGEVTVSVSGGRPQLEVVDPSGQRLTGPPQLVTTLDLSEIMIVKVLDPEPGNWSITVGSEKDYSVKVVGLSDLSFHHGFSVVTPASMAETSYRPLQGTYNNLMISPSNIDVPVHIDFAEILDLTGKTIFEVPLKPLSDTLYLADAFVPPDDFFNIAINGHDENGQPFRRIAPTAVQPKSPDAPYLTVPQKMEGRYHERVVLRCRVDSLVPVAASWTKNAKRIMEDIHALQSTVIEYVIPDMGESDVAVYRCVATNVAGESKEATMLQLTVDPPQVTISPANTTVTVGSRLTVACQVVSEALLTKSQIIFSSIERQNLTEFSLERAADGLYSFNTSVAAEGGGGKYTCVAANRGGQSKQSTYITVALQPVVQILGPHALVKRVHSDVQFVCHVDNSERVQWVGPGDVILHDTAVNGTYNAVLDVKNVTADGVWKCVATRGSHQATDSIELSVVWKPRVRIEGSRNVTVLDGAVYSASCVATARPAPRVLWHRETEAFLNHTMTALANDTYRSVLTLDSGKEEINATYFCFGENSEGIDQDSVTVSVRRKMALLQGFTDQSVELYSRVSLYCRVACHPPAEVSWFHNGTAIPPDLMEEDPSVIRIQRVEFHHLGSYVCVADNGFEKMHVNGSLSVEGLESPALSKEPSKQTVKKGEAAVLTCRVLKGNPKSEISWSFKSESSVNFTALLAHVIVRDGGSEIEIPRADLADGGSYRCVADNVIGQDVYDVTLVVHFPPSLSPANDSHIEAPVEVKVGDKKTLSCRAEGLPPPIVTWTKFGQPVSFSDNVHLTDNNELVIETATEYDAGVYACKVSNALGTVQRNFTLQVYSAPDIAPPGIEPEVNVVEGELVALPCTVRGAPPPAARWLHNGAPLGHRRRYVDEYGLRFVANLTDFGEYTCVATNQYGNTSISYNVFVWVPPHIVGPLEEKRTALAGSQLRLACDAVGFPVPAIMWEFRGELLTLNTSHIQFDDIGNLLIKNASAAHGGVYACVADNMVGVQRKYILLTVDEPATILPDYSGPYVATDMDSALVVPCRARGSPRPLVLWFHDGHLLNTDGRYKTDAEGSLVINYPSVELSGRYTCVAANAAGNVSRAVDVQIYPYLNGMQGEESRTSVTIVEGASAAVECPIRTVGNTTLKWYKDAVLIANGTLSFSNVSRHNASTYACVATNIVASAYANVDVIVQWAPRFVENVLEDVEVVKGDDWYFDCRVDSKPAAKVKWYFNSQIILGADRDVLKLLNVDLHRTGTYKCVASNDHGAVTRHFTLDVLVPPTISEFDVLDVQLKEGSSASLECNAKGSPTPELKWIFNNTNWSQVNSSLVVGNVTRASEGLYRCEARNRAGVARLAYRVGVVTAAGVSGVRATRGGQVTPEVVGGVVEVALGSDIRIACQGKGNPPPIIRWTKHGNTISENDKGIGYADLVLNNVNSSTAGVYSCITSNEGGMEERKVKVEILEPPRIFHALFQTVNSSDNVIPLEVLSGQPFYLHCHPSGTPLPEVYWFKDDVPLRLFDDTMVSAEYGETLVAGAARGEQAGNYTCVARNKVGNTSVVYLVDVLVAPPQVKDNVRKVVAHAGGTLAVTCPATGRPLPRVTWVKLPYAEISEQLPRVALVNDNYTLLINESQPSDSGKYSCVMTNKVGTTEVVFDVTVAKAPSIAGNVGNDTVERHVVPLRRSLVLKCDVDGFPVPKISWLKDIQPLREPSARALGDSLVALWEARARDAGLYICVAENDSGTAHRRYLVQVEVPGKWSAWSQWGYCNATCGAGSQARSRYCHYIDEDNNSIDKSTKSDTLILDESGCKGPAVDRRKCHMPPCEEESGARWSAWSRWGPCSSTCGAGTQARARRCRGAGGAGCVGDNVQIRKCPDLPKCEDYKYADNTESNEVLINRENREIDSNPYIPEAAFETQAEVFAQRPAHTDDHVTPAAYPHQPSYEVSVTRNLDRSDGGRCRPGYTHRATDDSCLDIDECTIETNECHATLVCVNTPGGYRCTCPAGYMSLGVGQRCLDVNECEVGVASCQYACVNVAGGYVCACPKHLRLHVDRHHCVAPVLYRTPLSFEESFTEEYLSASVDHPARYMKMSRQ